MIKRHILARLTRLGLAMYAMIWCMSFTVCAADHPLADMAVQSRVATIAEAEEELLPSSPGDPDELPVPPETNETTDEPNVLQQDPDAEPESEAYPDPAIAEEDDVLPEGEDAVALPEETANEDLLVGEGAEEITKIRINPTMVTWNLPYRYPFNFYAYPNDSGTAFGNDPNLSFYLCDENNIERAYENISIDPQSGQLYFSERKTECTLMVAAKYMKTETDVISAMTKVVLVAKASGLKTEITNGEDAPLEGSDFTVNKSAAFNIKLSSSNPEKIALTDNRISWDLYMNGGKISLDNEIDHASFTASGDTARVDFDNYEDTSTFKLVATYNNSYVDAYNQYISADPVNATITFRLNPIDYSYDVEELSFGDFATSEGYINVTDIAQNVTLTVQDRQKPSAPLDPLCIEWGFVSNETTDYSRLNETWSNISLDINGSTAHINLTNATENCEFKVVAKYNNNNPESTPVVAAIPVVVDIFDEIDVVSAIGLDKEFLTITDLSQKYTVSTSAVPSESILDPDKLSFTLYDIETGEVIDDSKGVSIEKKGTSCVLDCSELNDSVRFTLNATYTNMTGDVLNASCTVAACVLINELGADVTVNGAAYEGDNRISYTNLTSTENFTINLKSLNPSGAALDLSKVTWYLYAQSSSSSYALNSTPVKGTGFECSLSRDGQVNLRIDKKIVGHEYISLSATYRNSYVNASGNIVDNHEDYAYYSFIVDVDNPDNVSGIKMNTSSLTITRFTQAFFGNVVSKDGKGNIDGRRVSFTLLDENGEETPSITGVSFSNAAPGQFVISPGMPIKHARFYIRADYTNSNGTKLSTTLPVVIQYVIDEFNTYTQTSGEIEQKPDIYIIKGSDAWISFSPTISFYHNAIIDPERFTLKLMENGQEISPESGITCTINAHEYGCAFNLSAKTENAYHKLTFSLSYNNTFTDANGKVVKPANPEKKYTVIVDTRPVEETVEAHLPETKAAFQLYKETNEIPYLIRYTDAERGTASPSDLRINYDTGFRLVGATAADEKIIGYLNTTAEYGSGYINVNLNESYAEDSNVLNEIIKKKSIKAYLEIDLDPNPTDDVKKLITTENMTITFDASKPTAKASDALVFDSYFAGAESREIAFDNDNVYKISFVNETDAAKAGLVVNDTISNTISTTSLLPATSKKKTIKVVAFINDPDYRLPEGYNVTVPITYTVKNSAPKVSVKGATTYTLNTFTQDVQTVSYIFNGSSSNTELGFRILNSRGKSADGCLNVTINNNSSPWISPVTPLGSGELKPPIYILIQRTLNISCNENTEPGQTYKVALFARNSKSEREGAVTTITVKTVSEKDSRKPSISLKTKGAVDACLAGSYINITVSGKNINLYNKSVFMPDTYWKVTCEGENITGSFTLRPVSARYSNMPILSPISPGMTNTTNLMLGEAEPFSLLKAGLAGKKATLELYYGEYPAGSGNLLKANYTFKIGKSTVTPKLKATSVSYNPGYDTGTVNASITNLFYGIYNYTISMSCDKKPVNWEWNTDYTMNGDIISITPGTDISKYAGKTVTVKITPTAPYNSSDPDDVSVALPAKTATLSIKVLNPAKAKPSLNVKVKGSIDNIRDKNVTLGLSYKNLYDPEEAIDDIDCSIYRLEKYKGKSYASYYDNYFNVYLGYAYSSNSSISISPDDDYTLPVGTYYANVSVYLENHPDAPLNKVVSFKVTRGGKTGISITPCGSCKLTNRDFGKNITYNITVKDDSVNEIEYIRLGSKVNSTFTLRYDYYDTYAFNLSMYDGYVEKSKGKPITKAVTKTVPIEVYYYGSNVPDKVNIKVTINP